MTTLFPPLLIAGAGLALLPVLLHLLSLRQRQPIRWAAMEFLLESRARNRTWVNFKQWLLLAARVLAVLLAGLMAARPQMTGGLAALVPGEPVHHVVLLDDTYSMDDRGGERTPWERATAAVGALATRATEAGPHRMTIILASQPDEPLVYASNDLSALRERVPSWQASEFAGGLNEAINAAAAIAGQSRAGERVVAYVLSDFRQRDLRDTGETATALERLRERAAVLTLSPCVDRRRGNLTITDLQLEPSAVVSGIEMIALLTVTNHGTEQVGRTAVRLWRDGKPLPSIEIDSLPAGESVTRRFSFRCAEPGEHHLLAELPEDAVAADNRRCVALDLPAERPVLIIDGSRGHEGRAFATALRPRGGLLTGWLPEVRQPDALSAAGDLSRYAAVLMLDASRFTGGELPLLQRHTQEGGGLLLVLGEQVDRNHYNRRLLADAEQPLLPIRLDVPTQTERDAEGRPARLVAADHPAMRVFAGDRATFLDQVRVRQRHALLPVADETDPTAGVRVLASLSIGAPMLVESIDSQSRLLCLMTTTARSDREFEGWSNLSVSPLFPVFVNELTAYLAEPRLRPEQQLVGAVWRSVFTKVLPGAKRLARLEEDNYVTLDADTSQGDPEWGRAETAGVYRIEASAGVRQLLAVNANPREGDLAFVDASELERRFGEIGLAVLPVNRLAGQATQPQVALYQRIAIALLILLAIEQAIAYWCSYHRAPLKAGGAA